MHRNDLEQPPNVCTVMVSARMCVRNSDVGVAINAHGILAAVKYKRRNSSGGSPDRRYKNKKVCGFQPTSSLSTFPCEVLKNLVH